MAQRAIHKVSDNWFAQLNAGVDASTVSWVLKSSGATGLPAVSALVDTIVHCGTEKALITAVAEDTPSAGLDTLTVTRGYGGTTAATHSADDYVGQFYYEDYHNDNTDRLAVLEFALAARGNGVDQNGGALAVTAEGTPSMAVNIGVGWAVVSGQVVALRAATTLTFVAPVTDPRIDLIVINQLGVVSAVAGTENASPSAPSVPSDSLEIAKIHHVTTETHIDNTDGGDGYIDLAGVTYL